jgi:hypothetical protein
MSSNAQFTSELASAIPPGSSPGKFRLFVDSADGVLKLKDSTGAVIPVVGLNDYKESVRAASAIALPSYTLVANVITADAPGALPAQDGVTLVVGDALLYMGGSGPTEPDNGIYIVTQVGSGLLPFILTRRADFADSTRVTPGAITPVEPEGTTNSNKIFILATAAPIVLNTTPLTFVSIGGGGGTVRDPQFWAGTSNPDGTWNTVAPILNSGAFTSQINGINYWDSSGDQTTDLPAVGAGDHNKIVAYFAWFSVPGAGGSLTVSRQGSTGITAGRDVGLTSYKLHGDQALHVFRYDEGGDKWILVQGAGALSGHELRSKSEYVKVSQDYQEGNTFGSVNDDFNLGLTGVQFGRATHIGLRAGNPFDVITGWDASTRADSDFCPRKIIYIEAGPVAFSLNDGGSLAENRIITIDGLNNPTVGNVGDIFTIQYFDGIGWVLTTGNLGLTDYPRIQRTIVLADATAQPAELLRVDCSGGDVTVFAPASPFDGQRFAVSRIDYSANNVVVDGNGNSLVGNPPGGSAPTWTFVLQPTTANAGYASWIWSSQSNLWILDGDLLPQVASNIGNDSGVPGTQVSDALAFLQGEIDTLGRGSGTVETTDGSPTLLLTYETSTDERAIIISARVWCREPATDDSAYFVIEALFNCDGVSVVTSKDENFISVFRDQPAWDVTFAIVGTAIHLNVTGEAAKTIEWKTIVEIHEHG